VNGWPARLCITGSLTLLIIWPSWGQKTGPPQPPRQPGPTSNAPSPNQSNAPPPAQTPTNVWGRVILESGQPVPESVSVQLRCGVQLVLAVQTDLKGNFQFVLGAGPQNNDIGMNASDDTPAVLGATSEDPPGFTRAGSSAYSLWGCEVEVSVPGYQPLSKSITSNVSAGGIDVGTLILTRIAGVQGAAISVTSLSAPGKARKEFEKGEKDARNKHLDSATKHLEKAVAEYDNYAVAWNELGRIYATNHHTDDARQAFTRAMVADPQYIPPCVGLADMELQSGQYEAAIEAAGKALKLYPGMAAASFIQAVANLRLNRLDAAEKSARGAESSSLQSMPQLHLLLADILLRKRDSSNAAAQLQDYLKEAPRGQFAAEAKKGLEQIEKTAADANSAPSKPDAQPQLKPIPLEAQLSAPTFLTMVAATPVPTRTPWTPPDIDNVIPDVQPGAACSLPQVISGVGRRMKDLVENLQRFDATENVEHFNVSAAGSRGKPETRLFDYVVTVTLSDSGVFRLSEYRNGSLNPSLFPAQIATTGLPAMALIFHPSQVSDFNLTCEGLGQWHGRPAWQVHFAQRPDRPNRIRAYVIREHHYPVPLKGRVWIDAANYQVLRFESELMKPIPEIELTQEYLTIDYGPVQFQTHKQQVWLPLDAEVYSERGKRRFYRRHTFSNFKVFEVDSAQQIQAPEQSYCFRNANDRDIAGTLTVAPVAGASAKPVSVRFTIPSGQSVCKIVGPGRDVSMPADEIDTATFIYDGPEGAITADANLAKESVLNLVPGTDLPPTP
jgi:tetratricopeptide repeat protein